MMDAFLFKSRFSRIALCLTSLAAVVTDGRCGGGINGCWKVDTLDFSIFNLSKGIKIIFEIIL
jgi:hypothetical protein